MAPNWTNNYYGYINYPYTSSFTNTSASTTNYIYSYNWSTYPSKSKYRLKMFDYPNWGRDTVVDYNEGGDDLNKFFRYKEEISGIYNIKIEVVEAI